MTRAPALSLEPPKYYVHRVRGTWDTDSQSKLSIVLNYLQLCTHQHRHRKSSAPSSSCVDALVTMSTPPQPIAPSCAGGRTRRHSALRAYPFLAAPRGAPFRTASAASQAFSM